MKIAVFGGTGRTGIPFVRQALEAGHEVVVLARSPEKMPIRHDRLTVVPGDITREADVQKVISADTDAVVSLLTPTKTMTPADYARAVRSIVGAMRAHGVRRLIYMTGAGVAMPGDQPKPINHLIKFALRTTARSVYESSLAGAAEVTRSDRDWTILRAPMLTNQPRRGWRIGMVGVNMGPQLTREDAAHFILAALEDPSLVGRAPVVSC